jgi:DNA polymerase
MADGYDAGPFVPAKGDLDAYRRAAAGCRGCPLYGPAGGTVFGAGEAPARLMLVGEQPGDQEDRRGEPFVGPAGKLLDRALAEAGLGETGTYVTNAVKHFKFTERGKRRIHKAPSLREAHACLPWLVAEVRLVAPEVIVALGATAGRALLGASFRVTRDRGAELALPPEPWGTGAAVVATTHPSAVLRAPDRDAVLAGLVADLEVAARLLSG